MRINSALVEAGRGVDKLHELGLVCQAAFLGELVIFFFFDLSFLNPCKAEQEVCHRDNLLRVAKGSATVWYHPDCLHVDDGDQLFLAVSEHELSHQSGQNGATNFSEIQNLREEKTGKR